MRCAACGFENPVGFKFCGQCSTALGAHMKVAPSYALRDPRSYTPKHLGGGSGRDYEPFIRVERARLAHLSGDEEGTERDLSLARRRFTEMGAGARAQRLAVS